MDMLCCAPRSGSNLLETSGLNDFLRGEQEYELRVIVWEARAIGPSFPGKQLAVRVQPCGKGTYDKKTTDEGLCNSEGDTEFNWRMLWPMSAAEKPPQLKVEVGSFPSLCRIAHRSASST